MTTPTPLRTAAARVLALLVAAATTLLLAAPAHAEEVDPSRLTFGIGPADSRQSDDGRAVFVFGLAPGATAYDRAAVLNYAPQAHTFEVRAQDAINASDGSVAITDPSTPNAEVGRWFDLSGPTRVRVPGRAADGRPGRVVIPFVVRVPADAEPGDHAGAVVVSLTVKGERRDGATVDLVQRVAARTYVRVDGAARPELAITRLDARWLPGTWPWQPGRVLVDYTVENAGNVRMGVDPTLRLGGALAGARSRTLPASAELLPRGRLSGRAVVAGVWPSGPLDIGLVATPRAAVALAAPDLAPVARSTSLWALTWWLLVPLALLLALAGVWVRGHRRRRAVTADGGGTRHGAGIESLRDRLVGSR